MIRRASFALVLGLVAGCTELGSDSGLSVDYVLTTADPNAQNHADVLLRYEDDWLPGTCVGITRRFDDTRVVLEWSCNYETNAGSTVPAPFVGVLHDDDGDGVFVGDVLLQPVSDIDNVALGPYQLATFTMTPLP